MVVACFEFEFFFESLRRVSWRSSSVVVLPLVFFSFARVVSLSLSLHVTFGTLLADAAQK